MAKCRAFDLRHTEQLRGGDGGGQGPRLICQRQKASHHPYRLVAYTKNLEQLGWVQIAKRQG